MKILLPLLFLIGFSSPALADFKCNDLFGMWASDRYDNTTSSEYRTIKALNPDGSYWIKFMHKNDGTVSTQKEAGTWTCTDGILGIKINAINNHPVNFYNEYRLIKPSASFHSLKPIAPNCASVRRTWTGITKGKMRQISQCNVTIVGNLTSVVSCRSNFLCQSLASFRSL